MLSRGSLFLYDVNALIAVKQLWTQTWWRMMFRVLISVLSRSRFNTFLLEWQVYLLFIEKLLDFIHIDGYITCHKPTYPFILERNENQDTKNDIKRHPEVYYAAKRCLVDIGEIKVILKIVINVNQNWKQNHCIIYVFHK